MALKIHSCSRSDSVITAKEMCLIRPLALNCASPWPQVFHLSYHSLSQNVSWVSLRRKVASVQSRSPTNQGRTRKARFLWWVRNVIWLAGSLLHQVHWKALLSFMKVKWAVGMGRAGLMREGLSWRRATCASVHQGRCWSENPGMSCHRKSWSRQFQYNVWCWAVWVDLQRSPWSYLSPGAVKGGFGVMGGSTLGQCGQDFEFVFCYCTFFFKLKKQKRVSY